LRPHESEDPKQDQQDEPEQGQNPQDLKQAEESSVGVESEKIRPLGISDQPDHHGGEHEADPYPGPAAESHRRKLPRLCLSMQAVACRSEKANVCIYVGGLYIDYPLALH